MGTEVSPSDFARLETKVDRVGLALEKLVIFEERQANQNIRISNLETDTGVNRTRVDAVDKKVEQWINRGIGIWALAVTLWSLFQFFRPAIPALIGH